MIGNLIGSGILAFFLAKSGLFADAAGERAMAIAAAKTSIPFGPALIRGIGCNILVVLACWLQAGAKDLIGKIFAIWFPIMMFVFAGFEHSVANMTYIPLGIFLGADVSWGAFFIANLLPVTIGNLIGGAVVIPFANYSLHAINSETLDVHLQICVEECSFFIEFEYYSRGHQTSENQFW